MNAKMGASYQIHLLFAQDIAQYQQQSIS